MRASRSPRGVWRAVPGGRRWDRCVALESRRPCRRVYQSLSGIKLAGAGGLEPPPSSLTVRCPTNWTTPQARELFLEARPGLLGPRTFRSAGLAGKRSAKIERERSRPKRLMGNAELCKPESKQGRNGWRLPVPKWEKREGSRELRGPQKQKKRGEGAGPALNPRRDPRLPFPRLNFTLH